MYYVLLVYLVEIYLYSVHCVSIAYYLSLQNGWNALHFAASNNHPESIKLLISNGADITADNKVRKVIVVNDHR